MDSPTNIRIHGIPYFIKIFLVLLRLQWKKLKIISRYIVFFLLLSWWALSSFLRLAAFLRVLQAGGHSHLRLEEKNFEAAKDGTSQV